MLGGFRKKTQRQNGKTLKQTTRKNGKTKSQKKTFKKETSAYFVHMGCINATETLIYDDL